MYCKECARYPKITTTKETFCSECLEQKVVNDRSTSGFCEDCSKKRHFCFMCGESLLSDEERDKMYAESSDDTNTDDENSNNHANLADLLIEQQNALPNIPPEKKPAIHRNKVKPITPQKALDMFSEHMSKYVPDEMLDAVNELLIEQFNAQGDGCTIAAKDIMQRCGEKMTEAGKDFSTYSEKIFNFAPLYAESGWLVTPTKPENGDITLASFKFSMIAPKESKPEE